MTATLHTSSASNCGAVPESLRRDSTPYGKGREGKGREGIRRVSIHALPVGSDGLPPAPTGDTRPWMALRAVVGGDRG